MSSPLQKAEKAHEKAREELDASRDYLGAHDAEMAEVQAELEDVEGEIREIQSRKGDTDKIAPLRKQKIRLNSELRAMQQERESILADVREDERAVSVAQRDVNVALIDVYAADAARLGQQARETLQDLVDLVGKLKALDARDHEARSLVKQGLGFEGPEPGRITHSAHLTPKAWNRLKDLEKVIADLRYNRPLEDEAA